MPGYSMVCAHKYLPLSYFFRFINIYKVNWLLVIFLNSIQVLSQEQAHGPDIHQIEIVNSSQLGLKKNIYSFGGYGRLQRKMENNLLKLGRPLFIIRKKVLNQTYDKVELLLEIDSGQLCYIDTLIFNGIERVKRGFLENFLAFQKNQILDVTVYERYAEKLSSLSFINDAQANLKISSLGKSLVTLTLEEQENSNSFEGLVGLVNAQNDQPSVIVEAGTFSFTVPSGLRASNQINTRPLPDLLTPNCNDDT